MDIKQYIINPLGHYHYNIYKFINGEFEFMEMISSKEFLEKTDALHKKGYTRAFYEKEMALQIKKLERELERAKYNYEQKKDLFIKFKDEDTEKRYEQLSFFQREQYNKLMKEE